MSLKDLLDRFTKEGKLKEQKTDIDYLNNLLDSAQKNFEMRKYLQDKSPQLRLFNEF